MFQSGFCAHHNTNVDVVKVVDEKRVRFGSTGPERFFPSLR